MLITHTFILNPCYPDWLFEFERDFCLKVSLEIIRYTSCKYEYW